MFTVYVGFGAFKELRYINEFEPSIPKATVKSPVYTLGSSLNLNVNTYLPSSSITV